MNDVRKKYYQAFGKNLESLIKKHGTDVMTIASISKIEPKQIYRVLNGEHGASMKTILSIAYGLKVQPKELFDFKFDFKME